MRFAVTAATAAMAVCASMMSAPTASAADGVLIAYSEENYRGQEFRFDLAKKQARVPFGKVKSVKNLSTHQVRGAFVTSVGHIEVSYWFHAKGDYSHIRAPFSETQPLNAFLDR